MGRGDSSRRWRLVAGLALALCLLTAGCAGTDATDGTAGAGAVEDGGDGGESRLTAISERVAATREARRRVASRLESVNDSLAEADRKGVEVAPAAAATADAGGRLRAARADLSAATSALEAGNADSARERARAADRHLRAANESVTAARSRLETAYREALNASRDRLQAAYDEYQIAVAYVEAAGEAGAETGELRDRLNRSRERVRRARTAIVDDRNPGTAEDLAADVVATAESVQTAAVAAGREAVARDRLASARTRLSSDRAGPVLRRAESRLEAGAVDDVASLLVRAQRAEQAAQVRAFTGRVAAREGVRLRALNATAAAVENGTDPGSADGADGDVTPADRTRLASAARAARRCLRAHERAENATHAAKRAQAVLIGGNFGRVDADLAVAKRALRDGDYEAACSAAERAREGARTIEADLRERRADQLFVLEFDAVGPLIGSRDRPDTTVPDLRLVTVEPVDVSFSPPGNVRTTELNVSAAPVELAAATPAADPPSDGAAGNGSVAFAVGDVQSSECGTTCRDVSATLTNTGTATAHDVSATVEIYVRGGDRVKRFTEPVGTLAPGEAHEATRRLTFGVANGLALRNNGARIVLTIESDERDVTIERTRTF
jgi:hypothetical protein